jgi:hypothetical protein
MLSRKPDFKISIARGALETIFDECDRYDVDETGGRLIGTYHHSRGRYEIQVKGILDSGPKATRSPTSFFQDGDYQESMFRAIEAAHPEIEHLGSWHTHHVNGHPTLSGGDKTTYFKTVNHEKHNTDFFYALLVVSKNRRGNPRYAVKHFILRRDDDTIYEIPDADITVVDSPALLPAAPGHESTSGRSQPESTSLGTNLERAKDREFFSEFYPGLKPLLSKSVGAPYWKGALTLVDGSRAEVVAMENADGGAPYYSIATSRKDPSLSDTLARYGKLQFRSARHAVIDFERDLNQALYRGRRA